MNIKYVWTVLTNDGDDEMKWLCIQTIILPVLRTYQHNPGPCPFQGLHSSLMCDVYNICIIHFHNYIIDSEIKLEKVNKWKISFTTKSNTKPELYTSHIFSYTLI